MSGAATITTTITTATRRSEIRRDQISASVVYHGAARGATESNSAGARREAHCRRASSTRTTDFVLRKHSGKGLHHGFKPFKALPEPSETFAAALAFSK